MIWPSYRRGNVQSWSDPVVVPSDPRGRAARARCMNFFSRKFTKSRAQPPRGPDAPVPFQSTRQYSCTSSYKRYSCRKKVLYHYHVSDSTGYHSNHDRHDWSRSTPESTAVPLKAAPTCPNCAHHRSWNFPSNCAGTGGGANPGHAWRAPSGAAHRPEIMRAEY
jgi:hypothetical protein